MQQKQRLFIYSRREMGVLVLLGVLIAAFAFTLGVHLGKRVGPKSTVSSATFPAAVPTVEDEIPNPQEFAEHLKGTHLAADESLDQSAHDEVARTGLKLEVGRQVSLPRGAKSDNAGATSPEGPQFKTAPAQDSGATATRGSTSSTDDLKGIPAALRPAPAGKYTIQIGSHPALKEAAEQANTVEALGLQPYLRSAEIRGKGKWFRLYVGGFSTREAAEKAGQLYRDQHLIDSFVVANGVE
ncbi:MAG TPA: SPOR domain-containing protein [Bdellovibrionota bacterium]|nr:SPOR domain-containing protein [Bdellovibrionota bacterium]